MLNPRRLVCKQLGGVSVQASGEISSVVLQKNGRIRIKQSVGVKRNRSK